MRGGPSVGPEIGEQRIARIERDLITRALERTRGNRRQASALLGLKRTTLVEKLKRLGYTDVQRE